MPIYEYKCTNEHFYEEVRAFDENQKITKCPECNEDLKQVYSAPGIQLKGSGFYRNSK